MNTPSTINQAHQQAAIERRAAELFQSGYTYRQSSRSPEFFFVQKPTNNPLDFYTVDLAAARCDCPHFTHRRTVCKHLLAVAAEVERTDAICREYEEDMAGSELSTGCDAE